MSKKKFIFRFGGLAILFVALISVSILSQKPKNLSRHAVLGTAFEGNAIYDSCGTSCFTHLDTFHQAGFNMVLDYIIFGWTNINAVQAYAEHAKEDNIKVIWSLKDFWQNPSIIPSPEYSSIAQNCGCHDTISLAKYLVNQVKNDPATWGYYIADEPGANDVSKVAALTNAVYSVDPNHPRIIIKNDSLNNGNAGTNVYNGLWPYVTLSEVLGEDYYPVSYGQNINQTGPIANEIQYVVNLATSTYGWTRQSTMVLELNSGYPGNPSSKLPTLSQMQSMYNQVLANSNPRLILWYWYFDTPSGNFNNLASIITPKAPPTATQVPTATSTPVPTQSPTSTATPVPASPTHTPIPTGASISPTKPITFALGDINHDGKVNILDYQALLNCYGDKFHSKMCAYKNTVDLDNNGVIDGVDYNTLLRILLNGD